MGIDSLLYEIQPVLVSLKFLGCLLLIKIFCVSTGLTGFIEFVLILIHVNCCSRIQKMSSSLSWTLFSIWFRWKQYLTEFLIFCTLWSIMKSLTCFSFIRDEMTINQNRTKIMVNNAINERVSNSSAFPVVEFTVLL